MKERPIIFSGPMVRAILAGRKSQVRRYESGIQAAITDIAGGGAEPVVWWPVWYPRGIRQEMKCPYGVPGDRLWVRETWGYRGGRWSSDTPAFQENLIAYDADNARLTFRRPAGTGGQDGLPKQICRCSGRGDEFDRYSEHQDELRRYWKAWRPSIHMPRWASRLTLEITDVRVQRLQEISGDEAMAEGVGQTEFWTPKEVEAKPFEEKWWDDYEFWNRYPPIAFSRLWDSINGKRAPWASNPWVWCISFRRLGTDPIEAAESDERQEAPR